MLLLLTYGCSQVSRKKPEDDDVSIEVALQRAHASYLLGCVEAFKSSNLSPSFPLCKKRADAHLLEIEDMLRQNPIVPPIN